MSNRKDKKVNIPGTLRRDATERLFIWKPILAKQCTLVQVKSGDITLVDLQNFNALIDMQSDIQNQAIDDAKRENKTKGGG